MSDLGYSEYIEPARLVFNFRRNTVILLLILVIVSYFDLSYCVTLKQVFSLCAGYSWAFWAVFASVLFFLLLIDFLFFNSADFKFA